MEKQTSPNTCDNCHHREGSDCRRYPPQVSIIPVPVQSIAKGGMQMQPTPIGAFPQVNPEIWCGEWASSIVIKH